MIVELTVTSGLGSSLDYMVWEWYGFGFSLGGSFVILCAHLWIILYELL
jgi:hypothetical protein